MAEVIGPGITYLTRGGWGARTDLPRLGYPVAKGRRIRSIFHHTVIIDDDATANLWETLAEVKAKMLQLQVIRPDLSPRDPVTGELLPPDVPYNFVIFLMANGTIVVCEGRGIALTGAHTHGHNTDGIGTALQGNFQLPINVTPYASLISRYLGWLKYDQRLESLGPIDGHSDFSSTACPGSNLYPVLGQLTYARKEEDMALNRDSDKAEFTHMMHTFISDVAAQARHKDGSTYGKRGSGPSGTTIGKYLGSIRDHAEAIRALEAAVASAGGGVSEARARQIADEQDAKLKHHK